MKIEILDETDTQTLEVTGPVTLHDVFNGVGIQTDDGLFGVAQRDGGIELMLDGELIFSSASMHDDIDPEMDLCMAVAVMATVLERVDDRGASEVLERPHVASSVLHARAYLAQLLSRRL